MSGRFIDVQGGERFLHVVNPLVLLTLVTRQTTALCWDRAQRGIRGGWKCRRPICQRNENTAQQSPALRGNCVTELGIVIILAVWELPNKPQYLVILERR